MTPCYYSNQPGAVLHLPKATVQEGEDQENTRSQQTDGNNQLSMPCYVKRNSIGHHVLPQGTASIFSHL